MKHNSIEYPVMPILYTIGHSNLMIGDFISLLQHYQITCLVDVRSYPFSKTFPQFNQKNFADILKKHQISYFWLGRKLGGHRKEGYEAHIKTPIFQEGLIQLMEIAQKQPTTIVCAEKLYTKCHRKLIATVLTENGWEVIHIINKEQTLKHDTIRLL